MLQDLNLSLGVTIVSDNFWNQYGYETAYPGLKFHQDTGWGDWLSINPYDPTGNPNSANLFGDANTPGDDEEDEHQGELTEEVIDLILEIIRNR